MPLIEIMDVALAQREGERLLGYYIDMPITGTVLDGNAFETWGWVVGPDPVVAVEFVERGGLLRRAPVTVGRPDLVPVFPQIPHAGRSGFRTVVPLIGRGPLFDVTLQAVLRDRSRIPMGTVTARRRWRESVMQRDVAVVSIIIPCYNQAHYLQEAIQSALRQTYPHIEVVVINDGSRDNTAEVAALYPGVRYVDQENQGLAAARNAGIRFSIGDYLVFLDADDRLLPTAVEAGLAALHSHPWAAFASGGCRWIAVDGACLDTPVHGAPHGDPYGALLRRNYIGMPATVMYRRAVFEVVQGFDPGVDAAADYDLNLRITRDFAVCWHGAVVAEYRQRGASMSGDPALMLETVLTVLNQQKRYIRRSREHRDAWADGARFWRRYYGEPLAELTIGHVQRRQWRAALPAAGVLLRRYPAGFISAIRGVLRD